MKKFSSLPIACCLMVIAVLNSCKKDNNDDKKTDNTTTFTTPVRMTVDIPSSINFAANTKKANGSITPLSGNDIYKNLRVFVAVGSAGAKIIDGILTAIQKNNITKVQTVTFTGDDGYSKKLTMSQNVDFSGTTWKWKMLIKDKDSSQALELFWNESPVKGIAIYQASKLNHNDLFSKLHPDALVQIEYSEAETNYDKQMIVSISGLHVYQMNDIDNFKMFVGKKGSNLDIYGNSNHPTALIIDPNHTGGRNWAFVAHSDDALNIAVAQVALPECNVTVNDNALWTNYSIKKVLEDELNKVYNNVIPADSIHKYLQNAEAPGYFVAGTGFVSCGTTIPDNSGFTSSFLDLTALKPYVPNEIKNLKITF